LFTALSGLVEPAAKSGGVFTFGSLKGRPVRPRKGYHKAACDASPCCVPFMKKITERALMGAWFAMTSWLHSPQNTTPLSYRTSTPCVYVPVTVVTINAIPCDGRHHKRKCDTIFFVCLLVRRYRIDALALPLFCFVLHRGSRMFSAMRNEHSGKYTPRLPHCPSCAQLMRLARTTSRFGGLPDLYAFECRVCGVTHIEAATVALGSPSPLDAER